MVIEFREEAAWNMRVRTRTALATVNIEEEYGEICLPPETGSIVRNREDPPGIVDGILVATRRKMWWGQHIPAFRVGVSLGAGDGNHVVKDGNEKVAIEAVPPS